MRRGLLVVALGVALVVPAPGVPLGRSAARPGRQRRVSVEAAATSVLQEAIADDVRATVLGLNDSVIIGAALVGSLLAPVSVALVGGGPTLGHHRRRSRARGRMGPHPFLHPAPATTSGLPSGVSRQEAHEEEANRHHADASLSPSRACSAHSC